MAGSITEKTETTTRLDTNIVANVSLNAAEDVELGFDTSSTKVAGLMKTANMLFKILLTQKGSNPLDTEEGTELPSLFESNISDEEVLYSLMKGYLDDAVEQVIGYQNNVQAPSVEKLARADISVFEFFEDIQALRCAIDIYNEVGDSSTLEIPSIVVA